MASTSTASPRVSGEPKLIIPGLAGFYEWAEPYAYPLMRFCVGAMLIPIGWTKLQAGTAPVVATMTKFGLEPVGLMAFCVIAIESLGALCIAVGFLTRFWAAALAIEMAVISYMQIPAGYTRMEQFLLWGMLAFIIALRGAGRFSIDRAIGWEL
ncbi:MAG: DoxX family protein [Stellaceae bacterium]